MTKMATGSMRIPIKCLIAWLIGIFSVSLWAQSVETTVAYIGSPNLWSANHSNTVYDDSLELVNLVGAINIHNENGPVDFTIVMGDVASGCDASRYATVKSILDGLDSTYYVVPGDSDCSCTPNGLTEFVNAFTYPPAIATGTGDGGFYFEVGSWAWVHIPTVQGVSGSTPNYTPPADSISKYLSASSSYLVVFSNHLFLPQIFSTTVDYQQLQDSVLAYPNTRLVLGAHSDQYYGGEIDSASYRMVNTGDRELGYEAWIYDHRDDGSRIVHFLKDTTRPDGTSPDTAAVLTVDDRVEAIDISLAGFTDEPGAQFMGRWAFNAFASDTNSGNLIGSGWYNYSDSSLFEPEHNPFFQAISTMTQDSLVYVSVFHKDTLHNVTPTPNQEAQLVTFLDQEAPNTTGQFLLRYETSDTLYMVFLDTVGVGIGSDSADVDHYKVTISEPDGQSKEFTMSEVVDTLSLLDSLSWSDEALYGHIQAVDGVGNTDPIGIRDTLLLSWDWIEATSPDTARKAIDDVLVFRNTLDSVRLTADSSFFISSQDFDTISVAADSILLAIPEAARDAWFSVKGKVGGEWQNSISPWKWWGDSL